MPKKTSFSSKLFSAVISTSILSLMETRPQYGRELLLQLHQVYDFDDISFSTIYPTLYDMERDGLIEVNDIQVVDGRARTTYCITELGKRTLANNKKLFKAFQNCAVSLLA